MPVYDSPPIRIVVAAVEDTFRNILRVQIERHPRIRIVGEAGDSQSARALIHSLAPDLLVIECELNRALASSSSNGRTTATAPHVIVIVTSAEPNHIVEAFELGAKSVVLKTSLPSDWGQGIEKVFAGHYWIADESSVSVLLRLASQLMSQSENPRPESTRLHTFGLTPREIEIARKIAVGRSNKELGLEFSICERTVKHHLTNIFRKVGVSSRLELAVLVRDGSASAQPQPLKMERA